MKYNGVRYVTNLPFKPNHEFIPDTYHVSLIRLFTLRNKLEKDPKLFKEYDTILKDYEKNGIIERVPFLWFNNIENREVAVYRFLWFNNIENRGVAVYRFLWFNNIENSEVAVYRFLWFNNIENSEVAVYGFLWFNNRKQGSSCLPILLV